MSTDQRSGVAGGEHRPGVAEGEQVRIETRST